MSTGSGENFGALLLFLFFVIGLIVLAVSLQYDGGVFTAHAH